MLSVQESNSTTIRSQLGPVALDHTEKNMQTLVTIHPLNEQCDFDLKKKKANN